MADGGEMALYLHEIAGSEGAGPTVGICAGIHGNERTGTEIVLEIARRYAEGRFRGKLVLLPVADPPAFAANRRHAPVDDLNLNRLFPGDGRGWFSDHLAQVITAEFLDRIDVLLDLHSGGDRPTVDYIYIRNAEELSRAFGSRVLYRQTEGKEGTIFSGTSVGVAEKRGIPAVTVELGGGLVDQGPYVARGVRGIASILSKLGMTDEPAVPPAAADRRLLDRDDPPADGRISRDRGSPARRNHRGRRRSRSSGESLYLRGARGDSEPRSRRES